MHAVDRIRASMDAIFLTGLAAGLMAAFLSIIMPQLASMGL
ncbi:hypothetical protein [Sphingobium aquiterrae]